MDRPDLEEARHDADAVEAAIAGWTAERAAEAIAEAAQARGIPAHAVLDTLAVAADPQLRHRGHFIQIAHPIYQTTTVESSRLHLSRTPAKIPTEALSLGRDNREVLASVLGYGPEQIERLEADGVLV